jgi:hypothetical protein
MLSFTRPDDAAAAAEHRTALRRWSVTARKHGEEENQDENGIHGTYYE